MKVIEIIFWVCLAIAFYTYLGYGILLWLMVKIKRIFNKRKEPKMPEDSQLPDMTLMICAYNEEDIVEEKMQNCNSIDYPKEKLTIMWVTDGSSDGTNDKLKAYDNVKVVFSPERKGKTAALNHGIKEVHRRSAPSPTPTR